MLDVCAANSRLSESCSSHVPNRRWSFKGQSRSMHKLRHPVWPHAQQVFPHLSEKALETRCTVLCDNRFTFEKQYSHQPKRATPITHPGSLLNSDDSTEHTTMMHPDNFIYKFMKIRLNSARTTKQMKDPRTYSYACYADDTSLQRDRTLTPFNKRKAFVLIFMLAASAQNTIVFTFPS